MNQVVYVSRGGNTEKLAKAVAKGAGAEAVPAERFRAADDVGTLFVGASIYAGSIDGKLRPVLESLRPEKVGRVVVFGTSAGNKTALAEIRSVLEPRGVAVADEEFHCRGSFLFVNRGRPNEEDLRVAEAFAKKICGGQA